MAGHWKWPGSGEGQVNNGTIEMRALEDETGELNTKKVWGGLFVVRMCTV